MAPPNIVQSTFTTQPSGKSSGSRPNEYTAEWSAELDDRVDFQTLLTLGWTAIPSATIARLPLKGEFFHWTTPGGFRYQDKNVLALDFNAHPFLGDGKKWRVDVTWRAPTPGAEEERDRVNQVPFLRKPYYWVEYYTETEEVFDARLAHPRHGGRASIGQGVVLRKAGEPGPLTTAAGEEVDLSVDENIHVVVVCERNVSSPLHSIAINARYSGKLNSKLWEVAGLNVLSTSGRKKHIGFAINPLFARFLRAETSQYGEWWNGSQYFKLQIRVRVSLQKRFYKNVPNRGTWYYSPSPDNKVMLNRDDNAVLGKVNLNPDGTRALTGLYANRPFLIPYQVSGQLPYGASLGFGNAPVVIKEDNKITAVV